MDSNKSHAAFILAAVLVVVAIGALIGTSVLFLADAERSGADVGARRTQSRALAWSGVQMVMEQLNEQRDELLRGKAPDIESEWSPAGEKDASSPRPVARIRAVNGRLLRPEAGKLDVNWAPNDQLAKVPGLSEELADSIIAARNSAPFASLADLLKIEGITPELLGVDNPDAPENPAAASASTSSPTTPDAQDAAPRLSQMLTVFAFDPNVQAGLGIDGQSGDDFAGNRRINLNVKWSDRLGKAIADRFGQGIADFLKTAMTREQDKLTFQKDSDMVKAMRRLNTPASEWPRVLDAFCTDPAEFRSGRVDVLTAPAEVLACIPGIDATAAAAIVDKRDKLELERRLSIVWPLLENILTPEQFELAVDHLTCRCAQWRVVVEGGFEDAQDSASATPAANLARSAETRTPLRDAVILEAVIDVASTRPRIAYLRDVTLAPIARQIAALWPIEQVVAKSPPSDTAAPAKSPTEADRPKPRNSNATLKPRELDLDTDLDLNSSSKKPEAKPPSAPDPDADTAPKAKPEEDSPEPDPAPAPDRRLGRWAPGWKPGR